MPIKLTKELFIQKAMHKHGDAYNYNNIIYKNSRTKICIICKKHGEFFQKPNNHLNGQGCPKCGTERSIQKQSYSLENFIKLAKTCHGNKYDYSLTKYINSKSKVKIICRKHGEFFQKPSEHLSKKGCEKCGREKLSNVFKDTLEVFITKSNEMHNFKYDYTFVDYVNSKTKVKIICPIHGAFQQIPSSHTSGAGCKQCSNKKRGSTQCLNVKSFIQKAKKIHNNKYSYSLVDYKKSSSKIIIICPSHGQYNQVASYHLSGNGCPRCKSEKTSKDKKYNNDKFVLLANSVHKYKYDYSLVNYERSNKKIKIICPNHGPFQQSPNNHLNGNGCPKCWRKNTGIESLIKEFLNKNDKFFKENIRSIIPPYELDLYLPDNNFAIECNGLYWHSELNGKNMNYHLNKTELCNKRGIFLIHIFENEINKTPRIVKSRLKNILNLNKYKICATKCEVKEINAKVKNQFLKKYHIQGADRASIKLGLFYKNRMVAVMTLCKNRVNSKWKLSRHAVINEFSISGGAEKLLEYFEKRFSPKKIIGYTDLRWSHGDFYYKLGFEKISQSKPNYWYFKGNFYNFYSCLKFKKDKLSKKLKTFDPKKTEWENMKDNGWNRIWDCGGLIFEKTF
jgi:hypothetical protein